MFLMVGDGPLRQEVRHQAQRLGIDSSLLLPGHQKDSMAAMAAMDVFLLTSRLEGLPNVLIEAQALGIPVVTTDTGGARETILEGVTGYAVYPHAAKLLAKVVIKILDDEQFRQQAREKAPPFISNKFGCERMIHDTLRAYGWQ
jgi:glycosyltransferase involved in cell wall biosynthesis